MFSGGMKWNTDLIWVNTNKQFMVLRDVLNFVILFMLNELLTLLSLP